MRLVTTKINDLIANHLMDYMIPYVSPIFLVVMLARILIGQYLKTQS